MAVLQLRLNRQLADAALIGSAMVGVLRRLGVVVMVISEPLHTHLAVAAVVVPAKDARREERGDKNRRKEADMWLK